MGSQESKFEEPLKIEVDGQTQAPTTIDEKAPSTPILTPSDPRSPSINIARTPLEILATDNHEEIKPFNITDLDLETKVLFGIDPRSPTLDFNRTPIIISALTKPKGFVNKNLDNVRKSIIQTTPLKSAQRHVVPPKLLESHPIITVTHTNKRKSFVGLLETNIDYTETDLDSVARMQARGNLNKSLPGAITDNCVTPLTNKLKHQMSALLIDARNCLEYEDDNVIEPLEEIIAVEEIAAPEEIVATIITPEQIVSADSVAEEIVASDPVPEETIEAEPPFIDEILASGPIEKSINITAQVNNLDAKLTHLIYQDDNSHNHKMIPRLPKIKEGNRTPLGQRNGNEKSLNKLKVSDKPRKKEISKIPVFKDTLGGKKVIAKQCENTPPRQRDGQKIKTKLSHWDADKTMVI